jgi:hypothetical protein
MSWEDLLRRVLPPIGPLQPHTTSQYGAIRKRGTSPHGGVDANYNVGPNGQTGINLQHPALRSPVDGIVTNAGEGTAGRIAIRDANGYSHEILHTHTRHVTRGDPVVVGQLIGTMGNMGVVSEGVESGDHHAHFQIKDSSGNRVNPTAYWNQKGRFDPEPTPPAFLDEHQQYLRRVGEMAGQQRRCIRTGRFLSRLGDNSYLALRYPPGRSTKRDRLSNRRKTSSRAILGKKFGAWSGFLPASRTSPDTTRTLQPRYPM